MITLTQTRSILVLFISIFYFVKIDALAQNTNGENNESEHLVHPKIKLPSSKHRSNSNFPKTPRTTFQTIKWLDLMPKRDLDSLSNPPDYLMKTDEGVKEDEIPNELRNLPKSIRDEYQRALPVLRAEAKQDFDAKSYRTVAYGATALAALLYVGYRGVRFLDALDASKKARTPTKRTL